jgi:hypothetical protein
MRRLDKFLTSALSALAFAILMAFFSVGTAQARPTGLLHVLQGYHATAAAVNAPAYTSAFSQAADTLNPVAGARLASSPSVRQRSANAGYVVMKRDAGTAVSARSRAGPKRR